MPYMVRRTHAMTRRIDSIADGDWNRVGCIRVATGLNSIRPAATMVLSLSVLPRSSSLQYYLSLFDSQGTVSRR
jgi:hypothetical protein